MTLCKLGDHTPRSSPLETLDRLAPIFPAWIADLVTSYWIPFLDRKHTDHCQLQSISLLHLGSIRMPYKLVVDFPASSACQLAILLSKALSHVLKRYSRKPGIKLHFHHPMRKTAKTSALSEPTPFEPVRRRYLRSIFNK